MNKNQKHCDDRQGAALLKHAWRYAFLSVVVMMCLSALRSIVGSNLLLEKALILTHWPFVVLRAAMIRNIGGAGIWMAISWPAIVLYWGFLGLMACILVNLWSIGSRLLGKQGRRDA